MVLMANREQCICENGSKHFRIPADTVPDTWFSQDQAGSGGAQFPLHYEYGSVGDASGGRKLKSLLPGGSSPAGQKKSQTTWGDLFSGVASSTPTSAEQVSWHIALLQSHRHLLIQS